ncbi:hypothetical protein [Gloeobacter kilaueensis]|uniref:Uncharacterized protein n=1 Tax=Gloeobacter kilaueensis (strain ATCC BAA-2537 / CCAP 1431/1 / ULC 316 / JS1) TaxID=1183438 RepID=U5QPL8_GLOK1|nr:hypothetical protein [Gloeobacter kilaueensis]AGY59569.1 hypothetical protein GKIL_3323 [Gloeobacter kilaueensis JS1]
MADSQITADLDTTIAALQRGLTSVPADQALALIDRWQQALQGTDLAEDLGQLKAALGNGDTAQLGSLLTDLGEDSAETATKAGATGEVASKLQQLSQLLVQAGGSLQ